VDYDGGISQENLIQNFQKLVSAKVEWVQPADATIYEFCRSYFEQRYELPALQTLVDYFTVRKDQEGLERLKDLEKHPPYVRSNYAHALSNTVEEQNKIRAVHLLKQSQEIITKGLIIDDVRYAGLRDGVKHFTSMAHLLTVDNYTSKTQGNLRLDGKDMWNDYVMAKANKALSWGKFCGLNQIDSTVRGIKRGELWIHAASTGEGKTTFALNWCYNLVTRYRSNVLFASLEMPYEQLRNKIYAIHSTHPKFAHYGKGLDYEKMRYGLLDDREEAWLKEVIADWEYKEGTEYGSFHVWSPDEDVTSTDIKVHAELMHNQEELHLLVIDHGGLVEARKQKRNKDATIELNSVLRDAKKIALHFNHGEKIPVLLLFQINREGKEYADKMEGRYKLKSLAQANEAERSADIVTTSYLNEEHRQAGTMFFDCLKRRDGPHFAPFSAAIYWPSGRLGNLDPFSTQGAGKGMSIEDMRNVDAILGEI
jgi:hypothetical protein